MKRLILGGLLALLFFCASPARAAYTITFDGGGVISDYFDKYTAIRQAGGQVVIDGPCMSACTLLLTQIEPENVCVTPRAIFGFHSGSQRTPFGSVYSADATGMLWFSYPPFVRQWLTDQGWDGKSEHSEFIWMDNETVRKLYSLCMPRNND